MSTLMYERGSYGARLHIFSSVHYASHRLSRTVQRNGDPPPRPPHPAEVAQCSAEIEIMPSTRCAHSADHRHGVCRARGSIQKIFWSELNQRLQQIAQSYWVPMANCWPATRTAIDNGIWSYAYLRTRGNTIEAALPRCSETSWAFCFWASRSY